MAAFNKVVLLGNLTRDPEIRFTAGGTAVADTGLAVNQGRDETVFVDVRLWARLAEIANQYLAKGGQVMIEGRLQYETWEDRKTGQKRSRLRVIAESLQMLGRRLQESRQRRLPMDTPNDQPAETASESREPAMAGGVPF